MPVLVYPLRVRDDRQQRRNTSPFARCRIVAVLEPSSLLTPLTLKHRGRPILLDMDVSRGEIDLIRNPAILEGSHGSCA